MIHLNHISKSYGPQTLFDELSWTIPRGERIGLVGANGAGKTTLFRLIIGEESADGGDVGIPGGVSIGYLPQEIDGFGDHSAFEEVLRGRQDLLDLEHELERLSSAMESASDAEATELSLKHGEAEARYGQLGGYTFRPRARSILSGMGFSTYAMDRLMTELSGGWQMRAALSRLLLESPDLLLMDEPTNHLDLPSVEWLEVFLRGYDGSVVIISHDRYFLNRMVTSVARLAGHRVQTYAGNYDAYVERRDADDAMLLKQAEQQRKEVAKMEAFVDRFRYKATKAKQAQSRLKALEKIDRIDAPIKQGKAMAMRLPEAPRSGKVVMDLQNVAKSYGELTVYENVDFHLERGERVALVGPNGEGKTTLLKMLAGELSLDAGERLMGHNVEIGFFAQHQVDALDMSATVLEEMNRAADHEAIPRVRSLLGAFLFSGKTVDKPISVLSGGEKNRLALAKMLLRARNLLLLDEPTNHLDIESRDVLQEALASFEGTIVFISHDRHFINALAERVVHVEAKTLAEYPGDYNYYRWKREEAAKTAAAAVQGTAEAPASSRKLQKRQRAELRRQRAEALGGLRKELDTIEATIATLEERQAELETTMADPDLYTDNKRATAVLKENSEVGAKLEALFERWEVIAPEVEAIEARYEALGLT